MERQERITALRCVLELKTSMAEAVGELSRFAYDSDEEIVTLLPSHVVRILDRYLSGELTEGDIEGWAEALLGRDDIGLLMGFEESLKQALFELSTPDVNEPISRELARRWAARFRGPS
ncbi:hypothetical protein [Amycolatopsis sp. SID8362]|uniref:hypothetical protein n=1 Tax=Amycolatopsis sp. SID8362 TaxID=2690346 RepID=UPI001367C5C0|nr:hypothetical protein [Amycolatopsis sp. SID8362]NBH08601.1 hypothetical protein [Amycolatopsis sp. SID8362]NED45295.1 hypothetical protein [Amycolatopsis sp. SID8362]